MEQNQNPNSPGRWDKGTPPENVSLGVNSLVTGELAFKRFHSREEAALVIGAHCTMDGVQFAVGEKARSRLANTATSPTSCSFVSSNFALAIMW